MFMTKKSTTGKITGKILASCKQTVELKCTVLVIFNTIIGHHKPIKG